MKIINVGFFPLFALALSFIVSCKAPAAKENMAVKNYNNYCMGCHGADKEAFINKDWMYGKDPEAVFSSIKNGHEDIGMPAFAAAFTDSEIKDLVNYLLGSDDETNDTNALNDKIIIQSEKQKFYVDTVVTELEIPWGMTWLPNGDMLINERSGNMYRFSDGKLSAPIEGTPEVFRFGQGGLLDIELHPKYEENGWIYISYSHPAPKPEVDGGNTAIMRFKLDGNKMVDKEVLFVGDPFTKTGPHFGSRLEFDNDGYLFFSIGDRGRQDNAQKLDNTNGKLHRINDDGTIPTDNPFYNEPNAKKTIYNFGHRNQQGLALQPETGLLWSHEHGPKGGDEINIEKVGVNYGWPKITFGINYNGTIITEDTAKVDMAQPITYYVPSIAPCGMDFVEGGKYKHWEGNILVGSLRFKYLERVELQNNKVVHQEKLLENIGRVRNVKVGPDGLIYVAIEKPGKILRLIPVD